MFGTKYVGAHRAKSTSRSKAVRRITVPLTVATAIVFGFGAAANAAPVKVVKGDTFSQLVVTHCGTGNWESIAFPNRNKNKIYAGEIIDITCPNFTTPIPVKKAEPQTPAPVAAPAKANTGWYSPLPGNSPLCNYWQWRGNYNHRGEDIPASSGNPIHAAHSGNVQTSWEAGGAGNYTVITHDGMAEVYMHQSSFKVRSGWVNGGDIIGYVGSTGDARGSHLHFEIQPNGPWKGVTSPDKWMRDHGASIGNC